LHRGAAPGGVAVLSSRRLRLRLRPGRGRRVVSVAKREGRRFQTTGPQHFCPSKEEEEEEEESSNPLDEEEKNLLQGQEELSALGLVRRTRCRG